MVALGGSGGGMGYPGSSVAQEGPYLDLGGGNTHVCLGKKSLSFTLKIYAVYCLYVIPHFK